MKVLWVLFVFVAGLVAAGWTTVLALQESDWSGGPHSVAWWLFFGLVRGVIALCAGGAVGGVVVFVLGTAAGEGSS